MYNNLFLTSCKWLDLCASVAKSEDVFLQNAYEIQNAEMKKGLCKSEFIDSLYLILNWFNGGFYIFFK